MKTILYIKKHIVRFEHLPFCTWPQRDMHKGRREYACWSMHYANQRMHICVANHNLKKTKNGRKWQPLVKIELAPETLNHNLKKENIVNDALSWCQLRRKENPSLKQSSRKSTIWMLKYYLIVQFRDRHFFLGHSLGLVGVGIFWHNLNAIFLDVAINYDFDKIIALLVEYIPSNQVVKIQLLDVLDCFVLLYKQNN